MRYIDKAVGIFAILALSCCIAVVKDVYRAKGSSHNSHTEMILTDDGHFNISCTEEMDGTTTRETITTYTGTYREATNVFDLQFKEICVIGHSCQSPTQTMLDYLFGNYRDDVTQIPSLPFTVRINKHPQKLFLCNMLIKPVH